MVEERYGKRYNVIVTAGLCRTAGRLESGIERGYYGKDGRDRHTGLSIWQEEKYRALQGTYPVISLSFANVKEADYYNARRKICRMLTDLYADHAFLPDSDVLQEKDKEFFRRVSDDMSDVDAILAIHYLFKFLSLYYDKKVIILLDDVEAVNEYMNRVACETFSFFDTGKRAFGKAEPERFYHGFVLGLMVQTEDRYVVTSNRESGFGSMGLRFGGRKC